MGIVHWLKRVLGSKRPPPAPSPQPPSAAKGNTTSPTQKEPQAQEPKAQPQTLPPSTSVTAAKLTPAAVNVQSAPTSRATWVSAEKTVQVGGYDLPGFVYVGDHLKGISSRVSTEPALIRPQLKLDETKPDRTGHWLSEWPSYSEIPSASRAAYLEWLAAGRQQPQVPLGYVLLFFYGLERRVLRDFRRTKRPITSELRAIMAEVERLGKLYGTHATFGQTTHAFLETCRLLNLEQITTLPPPWPRETGDSPLSLAVGLGTLASQQRPLPADWALCWAMHTFPSKLRTSTSRCFPEWRAWFQDQYHQTFKDGLLLEPEPGQGLSADTITYQPASVSFGGPVKVALPDLPKVANPQKPLGQILPLMTAGMEALDPYSRWLGRNPEGQGSYSALLLLPQALIPKFSSPQVKAFQTWVENCLSETDLGVVSGQDLLQQWCNPPLTKLTKSEATVLSDYLAQGGIGIEPDVKLGGKPPSSHQPIVLFRLSEPWTAVSDTADTAPSEKYKLATLLLHLAVMVAVADGEVSAAEQQRLQDYLASTPHLSNNERVRLHAHLRGLLAEKLTLRGLKAKVQTLAAERKLAIAQFLIHLAAVDGEINPPEISILNKLYPLLGLEAQTLYSHINDITVNALPAPPSDSPSSAAANPLQLDRALIDAKVTESATVSALLAEVFIEEDLSNEAVEPDCIQDQVHTQLLQQLGQQSEWHRQDLEPIATHLGLLLDGALEILNEAAFEQFDQPLTEGEDPIAIDPEILQALLDSGLA